MTWLILTKKAVQENKHKSGACYIVCGPLFVTRSGAPHHHHALWMHPSEGKTTKSNTNVETVAHTGRCQVSVLQKKMILLPFCLSHFNTLYPNCSRNSDKLALMILNKWLTCTSTTTTTTAATATAARRRQRRQTVVYVVLVVVLLTQVTTRQQQCCTLQSNSANANGRLVSRCSMHTYHHPVTYTRPSHYASQR